jgi:hypothetical protein
MGKERNEATSFLEILILYLLMNIPIKGNLPVRIYSLALLAIFIACLAWVQFAHPAFPDPDSYYHTRLSALMGEQGLKPPFPYLPLSVLNEREYYDHHFLFHVAMIPFTWFDLRLGGKWAAVLFAAVAFMSIWNLLRGQHIRYAWLWALGLLAVSAAFLYRFSQVRAQSLSLAVLALALHWMMQGKYGRLVPLGFVYVWLYNAFPLLAVLAGAYTTAILVIERRLELRPLIFAGIGLGLGLLINPYFPSNVIFAVRHIAPKVSDATAVDVGNEWFPYRTATLLENSPLALAALALGAIGLGLRGKRMDTPTAASLFIALGFGYMLFTARRYVEYYPPFALIFSALAWAPLLNPDSPDHILQGFHLPSWLIRWGPHAMLMIIISVGGWRTLRNAHDQIAEARPFDRYAGAATWLKENTPTNARVFQTDWDDFPRLFYYNTHNTYLIGLDPTYMQLYNKDLYDTWVEITEGKVRQPAEIIATLYGSQYVHTDLQHSDFIDIAEADPGLEEVYRDKDSILYKVISGN